MANLEESFQHSEDENEDALFEEDDEENDDNEEEDETISYPIFSPFLPFKSLSEAVNHDYRTYGFSLKDLAKKMKLDFYG